MTFYEFLQILRKKTSAAGKAEHITHQDHCTQPGDTKKLRTCAKKTKKLECGTWYPKKTKQNIVPI